MAIVTYSNPAFGFGATYDDALLTHTDDAADLRLRATWGAHIRTAVAAAVVFVPWETTAAGIARGRAPSLLLTTDAQRLGPGVLGLWDWDEVIRAEAAPFMERTGAGEVQASAVYWRGFPVLQLATAAAPDTDPAAPLQSLGMLYTPVQTFSSLLVVPRGEEDPWIGRMQEVMDGFFLLPIEREGHSRTGHQHVRSLRLSARDFVARAAR
jgi:hypothetical protein